MEVDDMSEAGTVILSRRSVRAYRPEPVPDSLIRDILEESRWAPSWANTQSTWVYVLRGAALERIKAGLRAVADDEAPRSPDLEMPGSWPEPMRTRMTGLMRSRTAFVAAAEGRDVTDEEPRHPPFATVAQLFGAPVLLLLAVDRGVPPAYTCFDAGLLAQSIGLAAESRRLGTCIMASAVMFPGVYREVLPELGDRSIVVAMTLGHPDPDAPVNRFPRERATVDDFVTFVQ